MCSMQSARTHMSFANNLDRDLEYNGMWFEGIVSAIHDQATFTVRKCLRAPHARVGRRGVYQSDRPSFKRWRHEQRNSRPLKSATSQEKEAVDCTAHTSPVRLKRRERIPADRDRNERLRVREDGSGLTYSNM